MFTGRRIKVRRLSLQKPNCFWGLTVRYCAYFLALSIVVIAANSTAGASISATRKMAEQGDTVAEFNLGIMYEYGHGVPQSYEEAAKWFALAAKQGNTHAENNLGLMYEQGRGVPQSYEEAAKWFALAAKQGVAFAEFNLGVMYAQGHGVPQSYEEAAKWFALAAKQGNTLAEFNLGVMYAQGRGVLQDYTEAHMWLNLAAAAGYEPAFKWRNVLETLMTKEQLSTAQRMARDWMHRHYGN